MITPSHSTDRIGSLCYCTSVLVPKFHSSVTTQNPEQPTSQLLPTRIRAKCSEAAHMQHRESSQVTVRSSDRKWKFLRLHLHICACTYFVFYRVLTIRHRSHIHIANHTEADGSVSKPQYRRSVGHSVRRAPVITAASGSRRGLPAACMVVALPI